MNLMKLANDSHTTNGSHEGGKMTCLTTNESHEANKWLINTSICSGKTDFIIESDNPLMLLLVLGKRLHHNNKHLIGATINTQASDFIIATSDSDEGVKLTNDSSMLLFQLGRLS